MSRLIILALAAFMTHPAIAAPVPVTADTFTREEVARLVKLMERERLVTFSRAGTLMLAQPSGEITAALDALGEDAVAPLADAFARAPSDGVRFGLGLALAARGDAGERALVNLLRSPGLRGRRWLLQALAGRATPAVVVTLRTLVDDADRELAERALLDLAESEDDAGVELLRRAARGPDRALARKAALALAFQKDASGAGILVDEVRAARGPALSLFQTMKGLGMSGAGEGVAPLLTLFVTHARNVRADEPAGRVSGLADFEPRFRKMSASERGMLVAQQCASALAALSVRAERPEVAELLAHRNPQVRRMALEVLGACGDASAVPAVASVLERAPEDDEKIAAAQALRNVAAPEAVPALASAARRARMPLSGWIALARAACGDATVVDRVIGLARGTDELALAAITTLGTVEAPPARRYLEELAGGEDLQTALLAASSLSRPGKRSAQEPLAALLARGRAANDPQRLSVAALGLGMAGDARAVKPLEELLGSSHRSARRAAAVGLYYLTGQARRYLNMWGEDGRFVPLTFHIKMREEKLAREASERR